MWTIIDIGNNGKKYTFLTQKEYVVGRKDADILVPSDPSISRKHAVFAVSFNEANISKPHQQPILTLKDVSKFGTVVQDVCLKNTEKQIASGDVISFGTTGNSKYQAIYEPYILTTSCIAGPFKKTVKTMVAKLGGHAISEWRKECQLLVMSNLNVTVKVICALVSLKPIVTPQYLEDLIKSIEDQTSQPKVESYLPPLAESQLDPECVSFNPVKERQKLFQGKIFIFLSPKQFKKLCMAIELAGGTPMLMEEGTDDNEDDILVAPSTCVLMCDQADASQMSQNGHTWVTHVLDFLKQHKKRPITDPEIGYAILYCSTEDNCNPDKELPPSYVARPAAVPQSLSQLPQPSQQQADVLAENTEPNTTIHGRRTRKISGATNIDETRLEVRVKEEPVSQKPSEQSKAQTVRKRQREETVTCNDDEVQINAKRLHLGIPVKQEVFTPQQDTHEVSAPSSPGPRSPRRGGTKKTVSPAHSPSSRVTRARSPAPSPITKVTRAKSPAPTQGTEEKRSTRTRRSPSPAPDRLGRDKNIQQVKEEQDTITQVETFDTIPDRKSRKSKNAVKQEKPTSGENEVELLDDDFEMDSIMAEIDTSVDDFDAVPSRKSRKKGTKTETSPTQATQGREVARKPVKVEEKEEIQEKAKQGKDGVSLVYSRQQQEAEGERRKGKVAERMDVKVEGRRRRGDGEPSGGRRERDRVALVYSREEDAATATENGTVTNSMDMEGFLSTRRSIEGQQVKISEFSTKEESLPLGCVVIQEKSLLARKPGKEREKVSKMDGNYCMWKGRKVRNYKKFNKVSPTAMLGLPTIIGGGDLVVHDSKPREEMEEWFKEEMQVESQQNEIDKMAMEMFDYEPPTRKRRQ